MYTQRNEIKHMRKRLKKRKSALKVINKQIRKDQKIRRSNKKQYDFKKKKRKRLALVHETRLQFKVKFNEYLQKQSLKKPAYMNCQKFHTHRKYESRYSTFNNTFQLQKLKQRHEKKIMGSNLTWVREIHDFYKPLNKLSVKTWKNRKLKFQ